MDASNYTAREQGGEGRGLSSIKFLLGEVRIIPDCQTPRRMQRYVDCYSTLQKEANPVYKVNYTIYSFNQIVPFIFRYAHVTSVEIILDKKLMFSPFCIVV